MQKTLVALDVADSHGAVGTMGAVKIFQAMRYYGTAVTTAVAAANSMGVQAMRAVDSDMLGLQMEALMSDMPVHGLMVGYLPNTMAVDIVDSLISAYPVDQLLVAPSIFSRQGVRLVDEEVEKKLATTLMPKAGVVVLNLKEASRYADLPVTTAAEMRTAAEKLVEGGLKSVVITGGALPGNRCPDVATDGQGAHIIDGPRVTFTNLIGAGTAFNAIVLGGLVKGGPLRQHVDKAKKWIARAANHPFKLGAGNGPVNFTSPIN